MWTPMFEDLQNKRVLVTGSSSGIGAGIARAFGALGARVAVHYHGNEAGAKATAEAIEPETLILQADLSDEAEAEALVTQLNENWGGLDILINNAGIVHKASILDTDAADWDKTLNINLRSPYLLSRSVAKLWIDAGERGCILHNTSIHGNQSVEFFSAYAASKAALNSLTAVQALEWAEHGIRVNAIAPGVTPVERTEKALDSTKDMWLPYIPLGEYGTPDDIANLAVFLCSEAARWITGQVMVCDGGTLARINFPRRKKADL